MFDGPGAAKRDETLHYDVKHLKSVRLDNLYRADSVLTSLGAGTTASLICRAIGLVRGVALAWLMPTSEFGLFGIALVIVNVFMPVCAAGLYEGVIRYAPLHEKMGTLRAFLRGSMGLVVGIALATTAGLWAFSESIGPALFAAAGVVSNAPPGSSVTTGNAGAVVDLSRVVWVCVFALAVYQTLLGLLQGLRMFRAQAGAELLSATLFTLLALGLAFRGLTSAAVVMAAYSFACLVVVAIFLPGLLAFARRTATDSKEATVGDSTSGTTFTLLAFGGWAAASAAVWHALSSYPMWYLLKVSGPEVVGPFHAVRMITQLTQFGAVILTAVVTAHVTRFWEHEGRTAALRPLALMTKGSLAALLAAGTALSVAGPLLMGIFPRSMSIGKSAYDPLVLFFLLAGALGLVAIRLKLVEKPRLVLSAWLVGAAVNVGVSFALLGSAGGTSVPQAVALSSAAWAGVAGVGAALVICLGLAARERLAADGRCLALIAALCATGFGWRIALPAFVVVIVTALATELLFTRAERSRLRSSLSFRIDR